jgi:hypothetical protein
VPQLPIRSVSQPRVAELRGMALALWWFGSCLAATRPRRFSPPRCLGARLTGSSPFGQPRGWLSRSVGLVTSVVPSEVHRSPRKVRRGRIGSPPSA